MNKNLSVVYVYVFPIRVEVSETKIEQDEKPIDTWEGHWENFLKYYPFTNTRVMATASEGILTLLSSKSTCCVSICY